MPRITPEEVLTACEKTGLKPATTVFQSRDGKCGCPVYALTRLHNPTGNFSYLEWVAKHYRKSQTYVWGFIHGFDAGIPASEGQFDSTKVAQDGWEDGYAVRKAVEAKYGVIKP